MKSDGCRLAQPLADELDALDVVAVGSVLDMVLMRKEFGSA
jgi:hypothetical protein